MASAWKRTRAEAVLYGYDAEVWCAGSPTHWRWRVSRGGSRVATGETVSEGGARAAARRRILAQPDAKATHEAEQIVHWNGLAFGEGRHASWANNGGGSYFVGACGATTGRSTNRPEERASIFCAKCKELLTTSLLDKAAQS